MHAIRKPRVKICCIRSLDEAGMVIDAGAAALGLVSKMPSGPGVIPEEMIAHIAARVPPGVATFLLTSELDVGSIIAQQKRTGVNTLQIVDNLGSGAHQELHAALPGIALVQVIHVRGPESIEEAFAVSPYVNALLLDSGNPSLPVKELGGTGRTHDWSHQPPNPGSCAGAGFSGRRADRGERRRGNSPGGAVWNRRVQWRSH